MKKDSYYTLAESKLEGRLTVQRSRFLAYAYHIQSVEEANDIIKEFRTKLFYDATHVCYAYQLGLDGEISREDDNGEPSGTAGKPILNKIRSFNLSDILVLVVRYFGGVKLGTSGLIQAYGEATEVVLESAPRKEVILTDKLDIHFRPDLTGIVMNLVNRSSGAIREQGYIAGNSTLLLEIRQGESDELLETLNAIYGVNVKKLLPLQSEGISS